MIDRLVAFHHWILLSEGQGRRLAAFLAGAVGALALAPIGLVPALALALPVAVWLLDGATGGPGRFSSAALRTAARDGWWFGFGYFLAGLWWIGAAFLVETDEFAWALPLGVLGLPAGLALFMAAAFVLARAFWVAGAPRVLVLAGAIGLSEYLRHSLLTGFPWNTFGQGLGAWLVTAQAASLIGTEGLTLLAVVIFAAPATLVDDPSRPVLRQRPFLLALALLVAVIGFGAARLLLAGGFRPSNDPAATVAGVRLRIVQPNISQRDKIAERDGLSVLRRLLTLSDRATGPQSTGMVDASHIFWPESPFPFLLTGEPQAMAELARTLPQTVTLLTGAVRAEAAGGGPRAYFNSLLAIGPAGRLLATYDKMHLVPFGEYLPLERVLSTLGLRRFVHAPGAFTAGTERRLLDLPGLPPVLPLICYEAIFPHELLAGSGRPGLIVNVTNDAWFGETFGPHQHFAQARLRAIEFGLPLVRVANTGISGLVDAYGRSVASSPVGVESIIDVLLPKALPETAYSVYGSYIGLYGAMLAIVLGLMAASVVNLLDRSRSKRQ